MNPGPSASIAGNKLSVRTTAEELNRRKATVYIHPIFAPCRLMGSMEKPARHSLRTRPAFGDTAGTTSETSINAVLSVMPQNEFALRAMPPRPAPSPEDFQRRALHYRSQHQPR